MKRNLIILFCLIVILSVCQPGLASVKTDYRYAYLVFSDVFEAQIGTISPSNINAPVEYRELGFPSDWRTPSVSIVSPNGQWILFITSSRTSDPRELKFIRLMNVVSGEVRDLEPGTPVGEPGSTQGVAWSPDSRYLALSLLRETSDIFLYSLEVGASINLTNDGFYHPFLSWSSDAMRLATFSENCPTSENWTRSLDILKVSDRTRETTFDLIKFAPATGGIGCELRWSPDAQFLSFVLGCDNTVPEIPKDVYLWNRSTGEATNVTNFTLESYQKGGPLYLQGVYRTIWYDTQNLLIGATYQIDPNIINTMTLDYRLPEGESLALFDEMVEDWTLNPTTKQVAIRKITSKNSVSASTELQSLSGSIQILTFDISGDTTNITSSNAANRELPLGCKLDWSPDGATLAYSITSSGKCSDTIQRFAFVDADSDEMQEYTPLLQNGSPPYTVVPIGWETQ